MSGKTRINKYLSESGYCSRRAADELIRSKRVRINGAISELGDKVSDQDVITVNGNVVSKESKRHVYIAFNKPKGIVCTTDSRREKNNIIDFINYPERIFPIGRLDKMSEGLILLTSDGDIVNKILRSRNSHEKEYEVVVNKPITNKFVNSMGDGVPILNTTTKKCIIKKTHRSKFKIILTQGLNRQIRRMCEYFEYKVVNLRRIRVMNINLDIPIGKWRVLRKSELKELNNMLAKSTTLE